MRRITLLTLLAAIAAIAGSSPVLAEPHCPDPLRAAWARIQAEFPDAIIRAELTGRAETDYKARINRSRVDDFPELMGSGTLVLGHDQLPVDLVLTRQGCAIGRFEVEKGLSQAALAWTLKRGPIQSATTNPRP